MRLILIGLPLFFITLSAISWGVKKFKELPFFKIHEVIVEGDTEIDLSGLIGKSIFELNPRKVKIDYENNRIRIVKVKRRLLGKVMVEVEQRKPYAILELQKTYEVDPEGFILRETSPKNPAERKNLPIIRIMDGGNPAQVWQFKSKKIMNLIRLLEDNFDNLKEVSLYEDDLVIKSCLGECSRWSSSNGQKIHLGSDDWIRRIEKLNHINWKNLGRCEIDLRFKDQIIVRQ